jgi:hypothetical protein
MLDVLPTKKGAKPTPYRPPVAKTVVRKAQAQARQRQTEVKDTKGNQDRAAAADYLAKHPEILHPDHPHHGSLLGTITGASALGLKLASLTAMPAVAATAAVVDKATGSHILKTAGKTVGNVPKDAAETVVATPTSLVKLADTAIHHPAQVPGMLAAPYKELAKHPLKTLTDHPVQTALMLDPALKVPGRAVGRVARVAGKQSLERTAKTLPGTALKETQVASRDALVNVVQKRRDAKAGPRTMSDKDVQRRVDEFHDFATQKRAQAEASAHREAQRRFADLPKAERSQKIADHVQGARAGSKKTVDRRFGKEFGATWYRDPQSGAIVKPKNATEGHFHSSREDAQAIADKVPFEAVVRPVGKNEYAVVPKVAKDRYYGSGGSGAQGHMSVGSGKQVMAKVMRRSRSALTQAVLPLSAKWLAGQAGEAGLRAAIAGAGPLDVLRVNKVVKELNSHKPGLGDEMLMRISGGQFGLTGTAREFAVGKRTLADEFADTSLQRPATAASRVAQTAPARVVSKGWGKYTNAVMNSVNGVFENTARKAMAGQAMRNSPLMDKGILGLSDKAIHDAAQGLKATENQVHLARAVDRMYGQYQKFSPERRSLLLHWTPFLPWYLNTVTFLTKVLPVDHPIHAALVADANATTEDWRKAQHMSLFDPKHRPDWMLGGFPAAGGVVPVAKFTPFGVGNDPLSRSRI